MKARRRNSSDIEAVHPLLRPRALALTAAELRRRPPASIESLPAQELRSRVAAQMQPYKDALVKTTGAGEKMQIFVRPGLRTITQRASSGPRSPS